jgi:hypothetical protein
VLNGFLLISEYLMVLQITAELLVLQKPPSTARRKWKRKTGGDWDRVFLIYFTFSLF